MKGAGSRVGSGAAAAAILLLAAAARAQEPVKPLDGPAKLAAPAAFEPKDGIVDVELSEYAGYAGLVAANGGLEPSPDSHFAKKHGFRVRIRLSEEESWSALNAGKMAASATTVDVLAVYGRQLDVVVPAQIAWSRGADALVTVPGIQTVNQLRGGTVASVQFTEADFFVRYLADEAGIPVRAVPPGGAADPGSVNLVYFGDPMEAAAWFLGSGGARTGPGPRGAGLCAWAPFTTDAVEKLKNRGITARVLATTTNLLVVADVLLVNRGFATAHPEMVAGLVEGLLEGNRRVRRDPAKEVPLLAKAFGWTPEETREELGQVHLSNLPENRAFFAGGADAGGSFAGTYWSAAQCYGKSLVPDPPDPERLLDLAALKGLEAAGAFKDEKAAILPVGNASRADLEGGPVLTKEVRFIFREGQAFTDPDFAADNDAGVKRILRLLQVGQGSVVRLRGFVDNAEYHRAGRPTKTYQEYAGAVSEQRARAVARMLTDRGADPTRIECVGTPWVNNVGNAVAQNRRVETEWFTLE